MNAQGVLSIPRKVFNRYKQVVKRLRPYNKAVLFVYGGRTHEWPGMGSELYTTEPVFRKTIQECDRYIVEFGFKSVLSNFEGKADKNFFEDDANVVFCIVSLQLALTELLKNEGSYPSATMGISLGEHAAVYAAGGVSLKDAIRLACSTAMLSRLEKKECSSFHLQVTLEESKALSQNCPYFFIPVFETDQEGVSFFCYVKDREAIQQFLNDRRIKWDFIHQAPILPYHTCLLIQSSEKWMQFINPVTPLPLECDYYSCTKGKIIPKNRIIDYDLWYQLKINPVLAHTTLQEAKNAGYKMMAHIGPHRYLKGRVQDYERINVFDSIRNNESEATVLKKTLQQLIKLQPKIKGFGDKWTEFINHFDLMDPYLVAHPHVHLEFLRQSGPVHYLPALNKWIVLDEEPTEWVLKNPDLFSSAIHKGLNDNLLGADPPSHTTIRSLLQPLLSQQSLNVLGTYASERAHQLLDAALQKKEFDFVNEFSLPLSQSVIAGLFKLTTGEESELQQLLSGYNIYGFEYLGNLDAFLNAHLRYYTHKQGDNIASLFQSFLSNGQLTYPGAVSLMKLLWIAGITTTSILLSNAMYYLASHPEMRAIISNDEQALVKFLEESLRLHPPETVLSRITTQEVELCGQKIPKNSVVALSLIAANRDPKMFNQPGKIMLDRPAKQKHLSFGAGAHYCMGVGLARIESRNALKVLLERMPDFQLAEENAIQWLPPHPEHFRALEKLMLVPTKKKD